MPVQIPEKYEYVWKYLLTHKTPVRAEKLAKRFIVSKTSAAGALNFLAEQGLVDVVKLGSQKFYRLKE